MTSLAIKTTIFQLREVKSYEGKLGWGGTTIARLGREQ
jgi:hypothetical protein